MRPFLAWSLLLALAFSGCMGGAGKAAPGSPSAFVPPPDENPDQACLLFVVLTEELLPIEAANISVDEIHLVVPTDASGQASVCDLPIGSYHVAASARGFDTSRKTVSFPSEETTRFTLRELPVLVPYHEILPKSVFYTVGMSTIDATVSRLASLNNTVCSPCSFEFHTPRMPAFVYWEARWDRAVDIVPSTDEMYHVFRGGAPFENPPGDTTERDIGSGSMSQPFHFQYHRNDMVRSPPVAKAEKDGGEVAFSGAMYCWGNPPSPCVNQRIDAFITVWYNILKVPEDYTALPTG